MILNVNKNATKRDVAWFALSLVSIFGLLGVLAWWRPGALAGASMILAVAWLVSLVINRDAWHLQILGMVLPLLFYAVGGSVQAGADPWTVAVTTWVVGFILALVSLVSLKLGRLLYCGWMLAAFPIGWSISHCILAFTYFLVITPIGLLMRMLGRDPMQRLFDRSAQTYWVKHETPTDPSRYFQQF